VGFGEFKNVVIDAGGGANLVSTRLGLGGGFVAVAACPNVGRGYCSK